MTYSEGTKYMLSLYTDDLLQHSKTIETDYDCLTIKYPGYRGKGDYQVNYDNNPPSHQDVCKYLYDLVKGSTESYRDIFMLLSDLYDNGTDILGQYLLMNTDADFLITFLFWMTLQDEINFPQPRCQGRRMPFSRYFEAIHCAAFGDCSYTLSDVMIRCNNKGMGAPSPYPMKDKPSFYY